MTVTIPVRHHMNARPLCEIAVSYAEKSKLDTPPPLTNRGTTERPRYVAEDHVVEKQTEAGLVRLFKASVNGADVYMTNTPSAVLQNAV